MKAVFERTAGLTEVPLHYCPGCTHGIAHRLVGECLEEMGLLDRAIGVGSVGCSVFAYDYFNCDMQAAAHGRAPAVATGIKRAVPDSFVFTYQGDGDLAAIGTAEIIHAAMRNEKISVIFINNAIYGMTGGQMAPTTLVGMKTSTSQAGREVNLFGNPIRISEMLAQLGGDKYIARASLHDPANIIKAKKAIRRAFEVQVAGIGFSLVEILSACPTNWGVTPVQALRWIKEHMLPVYPLGEFIVPGGESRD